MIRRRESFKSLRSSFEVDAGAVLESHSKLEC